MADEFQERLRRVLWDVKYLWYYGSAGVDSESEEEAPASKRKKKRMAQTTLWRIRLTGLMPLQRN